MKRGFNYEMLFSKYDMGFDGKDADKHVQASAPGYYDCIFTDVQMPV